MTITTPLQDVRIDPALIERALAEIELSAVRIRLAQVSFVHMCEAVFGWQAFNPDGSPVVPLHHEWSDHMEQSWRDGYYAGIQGPRDHGKTMQIAVARNIFDLGQSTDPSLEGHVDWWRPNLRIKLFQNSDTNAKKTVTLIRTIIERSPALHAIFPALQRDPDQEWSQHRLFVRKTRGCAIESEWERDPSFEGAGIMGHATSGRADKIDLDDICDLENSVLKPADRPKVLQSFDAVVFHLREPWTRFTNIGTAWHEEDANAALQKRPRWRWKIYRIQAIPGAPMQVLWPGKWDIPALEHSRENNLREFERGFNNRAISDEESLVNWDDVKASFRPDLAPGEIDFKPAMTVAGYDLAIGKTKHSAHFAAMVLTLGHDGQQSPTQIIQTRIPFRRQVQTILGIHSRTRPTPTVHMVESNGYQMALVEQALEEGKAIPVEPFQTDKTKADPFFGLPGMAPSFAAGEWVIGTKGGHDSETRPDCTCPQCAWLRELHYFPTTTSDILMASWFAHTAARRFRSTGAETAVVQPSEFAEVFGEPEHMADALDTDN
jgi:hypothetical protein